MEEFTPFLIEAFASDGPFAKFLPYTLYVRAVAGSTAEVVDTLGRVYVRVSLSPMSITIYPGEHIGKLSDNDQASVVSAMAVAGAAFLRVYGEEVAER